MDEYHVNVHTPRFVIKGEHYRFLQADKNADNEKPETGLMKPTLQSFGGFYSTLRQYRSYGTEDTFGNVN